MTIISTTLPQLFYIFRLSCLGAESLQAVKYIHTHQKYNKQFTGFAFKIPFKCQTRQKCKNIEKRKKYSIYLICMKDYYVYNVEVIIPS